MTKRRYFSIVLAVLIAIMPLMADDYKFKNLGVSDNLVGSQVNAICKDSHGFMWFGTSTGLSRYDGVSMRNFTSNFSSSSALPDSYIESIQEDANGTIWLRANGSYVLMNPNEEVFDRSVGQHLSMLSNNMEPELIFVDKNRNLWVYDHGNALYYYKISQQLIYTFEQAGDNAVLPEGRLTGIADTQEGVVAVFASGLVVGINTESQAIAWQNNIISKNMQTQDSYKVFYDSGRNIWVYGDKNVFFYDQQQHIWYRSLPEFCQNMSGDISIDNDLVTGVSEDSNGNVWVATDRGGLIIYRPEQRTITSHIMSSPSVRRLMTNYLCTIYIDDNDVTWVGTQRHGVAYWSSDLYFFRTEDVGDVSGVSMDKSGNVWMATRNRGLACHNTESGEVKYYGRANGLCDNIFSCILTDRSDNIWVGSNRFGLSRMGNGSVLNYNTDSGLRDNSVQAIAQDLYGNIWIGTKRGGLQCFNTKNSTFSNFNVQNGKLPSDNVTCIYAQKNNLVVGTANGVVLFNLSNNESKIIQGSNSGDSHFTSNSILSVLLDSRGLLWVGTSEGLNLYNMQNDDITVFSTTSFGLPSNTIYGIAEDAHHNMWIITNYGVCRMLVIEDANKNGVYQYALMNYDERDGLQGMEFNIGAIYAASNGNVFIGGQNGISYLNARGKHDKDTKVNIVLASLYINGQRVAIGDRVDGRIVLERTLNSLDKLVLRDDENDVRICLGISNYGFAEHPRFTYMLEGYKGDTWNPVLSDGYTIEFNELPSGTYKLHIRASIANGKISAEERVLTVVVNNVWYKAWWFYAGLLLVLLLLFFLLNRFLSPVLRVYRERKESISLYREKRDAMEQLASELRQDVVSMIPQLGLLQMDVALPEQKEKLIAMQYTIRQFLGKLNQLREDKSLVVNDDGVAPEMGSDMMIGDDDGKATDNETLLISDSGVVQGNGVLSDDGTIEAIPTAESRLFIIDSDTDMLEFMADCMKDNYKLSTFSDAEKAWDAIMEQAPDVIMCAHNLKGTTGSELCNRVKSLRNMERLPFILTTEGAMSVNELEDQKITFMADDYIPQPMNLKSAMARINKLIGIRVPSIEEIPNDDTIRSAESLCLAIKLQLRKQVDDYVMQNISRSDLSIDELSRALGVSRTLLFRKVESITGRAPADYIRAVRLQEAAKLLVEGSVSIGDIANEFGFSNTQNFSYYFKLEYGVLPTEYADISQNGYQDENNTVR